MKKAFTIFILMLSIFSIASAHPFKSDKELNEFFSKIDQLIKEELKKDYREEMTKRKGTANNEYSFEIEDDRTGLITRSIAGIKPETEITQYFNSEGKLYMISSLTSETDKDLYALYRKYDKNGNNIEILLEHLNSQTKSWELREKIEYLYDLSITKDKVLDRAYINDENETSVNLILEKKYYLYDGKKWILKENVKYLYDKK